jgi:cell division protein FtsL
VVALLTIWVWQRITVVKMIHRNDLRRAELQVKKEMKDKIIADLSRLEHRGRIELIAAEAMGMAPSRPGQQRMVLPPDYAREPVPVPVQANGWQRLNNSWRRLTVASVSRPSRNDGTP